MTRLTYDGSWEGFLCALDEALNTRTSAVHLGRKEDATPTLFDTPQIVPRDDARAEYLLRRISAAGGSKTPDLLYRAFLSEETGVEDAIYQVVSMLLRHGRRVLENRLLPEVDRLHRIVRRVGHEVHRMHAFVRFEEQTDGLFVSQIAPQHDVLPLIWPHFRARFGAMRWLIMDVQRRYAVYYDGMEVHLVSENALPEGAESGREEPFNELWRAYYRAATIEARRNPRLLLQHMPRRYWKHLPERSSL